MVQTGPEKPWYLPALTAFIGRDVPGVVGVPPAAFVRDLATLERRVAMEGESFLTKTLPDFGKSIDLALQGKTPLLVTSLKKRSRKSALPAFLQALTRRIFSDDGYVLENTCINSIRLLRQICYWCKKIEKGFTRESLRKAAIDFIEVDGALPTDLRSADQRMLGVAQAVIESILRGLPRMAQWLPGHGPGNVAGGEGTVGKRKMTHSYTRLEAVFRPIPFFFSLRDAAESPERVYDRMHTEYGLSRTQFVEKDSKGPRTIGLEPAEYMWCQQALKRALYSHIESPQNIASGQINFTDQSINRNLTREWADFVTLDMSKASDRNSLVLVETLFSKVPRVLDALLASRTPGTVLPDGSVLWYKKFAPMGSATCFPVEALVFYALAVAVLHLEGMPLLLAMKSVFVYGDDLILPTGYYERLDKAFRSVGLLFSEGKCCVHGKFRESCGMDAYDGENVTPVRMRKVYPQRSHENHGRIDPSAYVPLVEHSNALMMAGYRFAALAFKKRALREFPQLRKLEIPTLEVSKCPILHWFDPVFGERVRVKYTNWIPFVKGWVPETVTVKGDPCNEGSYLRESLTHGGAVGHLRPGSEIRRFDLRYATRLRKRKLVYWSMPETQ